MAVAVMRPSPGPQQKDPLETILQGLSIASGVYRIAADRQQAALMASKEARQAEMQAAQQEEAKRARQFSEAATAAQMQAQGFQQQPGANGGVSFQMTPEAAALQKRKELAQITALERKPETQGLDTLIKQLTVKEKIEKAQEVEGPKAMAAGYARRLEQSAGIIDKLQKGGFDRAGVSTGVMSFAPEFLKPAQLKQQEQAERNFVNAILRRESGAAISPSEFKSAEHQYFPRVGDDVDTLAQKQQNRQQAIATLKAEAGSRALSKVPLVPTMSVDRKTQGVIDSLGLSEAKAGQQEFSIQDEASKILQSRRGK